MTTHQRAERPEAVTRQARRPVTGVPRSPSEVLALQRTLGNGVVSRLLDEDQSTREDAPVQRSGVQEVLGSPGVPLAEPVRAEMEARLGADFSDVRLHTGASAQRSAAEIGARAYTSGSHVVIGDGGADKHTLAHELTHVIQQRQGPVAGTDNGDGLSISDPADRFEREAEANAARVLSGPISGPGELSAAEATDENAGSATRIQRVGRAEEEGPQYTRTQEPGPVSESRDAELRMLDRLARLAMTGLRNGRATGGGSRNVTPHLATSVMPDGRLGIAGNTGKLHVTDADMRRINAELEKMTDLDGFEYGEKDGNRRNNKDIRKVRAMLTGDYYDDSDNKNKLAAGAVAHSARKGFDWGKSLLDGEHREGKPAQHGEMTLLGHHVANWKKNPRSSDQEIEEVHIGGVKMACEACRLSFEAVNKYIGEGARYRVVASGSHRMLYTNWIMPKWLVDIPGAFEYIKEEILKQDKGARFVDGAGGTKVLNTSKGYQSTFAPHDPDESESEVEETDAGRRRRRRSRRARLPKVVSEPRSGIEPRSSAAIPMMSDFLAGGVFAKEKGRQRTR